MIIVNFIYLFSSYNPILIVCFSVYNIFMENYPFSVWILGMYLYW
jgi:hypothetical protein